jgi:hypothetical protein
MCDVTVNDVPNKKTVTTQFLIYVILVRFTIFILP